MCLSKSSKAVGFFNATNIAIEKNDITYDNCVSLAFENTPVNVGKKTIPSKLKSETKNKNMLMGC